MRRATLLAISTMMVCSLASAPSRAHEDEGKIDPTDRATAWLGGPAGAQRTLTLQYGPYVIGPGQDLSRVDFETVAADGYVIAARPALRQPDGTEPLNTHVHIHHAHWVWLDADVERQRVGYRWFFGTGEERTRGGLAERAAKEDPALKRMYGIEMRRGDKLALISMVHNKGATPVTVWIEAKLDFVYGTRQQIANAFPEPPPYPSYPVDTPWWGGRDFRSLRPELWGHTFNVPRDPDAPASTYVDRYEFRSPVTGTIIIGAGHVHAGGRDIVVENLGQAGDPCPAAPGSVQGGTPISRVHAFSRPLDLNGDGVTTRVFPSEDLQMGITKPGWRVKVRQGDRIALSATYDTTDYAYPDAMSFFGFYTDTEDAGRAVGGSCAPWSLDGDPEPTETIENRSWDSSPTLAVCGVEGMPACEDPRFAFPPGPATETVHIGGFVYAPGDLSLVPTLGTPMVQRGSTLTFVNEDLAADIRHTITSCKAPCNGRYVANYPYSDGRFDSGVLGPDPISQNQWSDELAVWRLDTTPLTPGVYTYYCRTHPFMRGAFIVRA